MEGLTEVVSLLYKIVGSYQGVGSNTARNLRTVKDILDKFSQGKITRFVYD